MITDYNQGKIYKLVPLLSHEPHDIYIGFTCYSCLSKAMAIIRSTYASYKKGMKTNYKKQYSLFDKYNIDDIDIILIENVNAKSKDELRARHAYHVETKECINKRVSIIKDADKNEIKDTIIKKIGYLDLGLMCNEYKKLNVKCTCGAEIKQGSLSKHRKSKSHQNIIEKMKKNNIINTTTTPTLLLQQDTKLEEIINNDIEKENDQISCCKKCNIELIQETKNCECQKCENWGGCGISYYYILRCPNCHSYVNTNKYEVVKFNHKGKLAL
jgi:hypothetical protein